MFPRLISSLALMLVGNVQVSLASTTSPLFARGYAVMPEPQIVTLKDHDFSFDTQWHLDAGRSIPSDSPTLECLEQEAHLMGGARAPGVLRLELKPGAVIPGASQDRDKTAIATQAYRIELTPSRIRIVANAAAGLFYGVQTFVQLLRARHGQLPEGEITDWPDLQMRQIYWDDAHHLERLSELKRAVRRAAFFKINGFVIKLEGHFQFRSAPALVEPQALSPDQLQELTDYGLRYHVQVIPYLDAPAHIAFILKHPEYAALRAFPSSNYEMCVTNPDALKLMFGMYSDLLAANRGVNYFYLSTDEAYYVGLSDQGGCLEAERTKQLGTVGKVLAEFVTKAAGYLHQRGRTVVFWGEYPLKQEDIGALPDYIVNGETYGENFDTAYKARGIRQMMYGATEGEEQLFPHYFLRPAEQRLHRLHEDFQRVPAAFAQFESDPARYNADLMGLVLAGWGDMGLHPETFWLGYATITSTGWKPWSAGAREATSTFYPLFYGHHASNMDRIYQLMSYQAQLWMDSWEASNSSTRKPIWGNSDRIFKTPQPAHDQTIGLPETPSPADLRYEGSWTREHEPVLRFVEQSIPENEELQGLIGENILADTENKYGLEVFLSITRLCRQNLELFLSLKKIDEALKRASQLATESKPKDAVAAIDQALAEASSIRQARNASLAGAVETWYKSWLPRVAEANGRRFLHEVDDVKDHLPDRTVDMTYLVYRELRLPFDEWYQRVENARNTYAETHGLGRRSIRLEWVSIE